MQSAISPQWTHAPQALSSSPAPRGAFLLLPSPISSLCATEKVPFHCFPWALTLSLLFYARCCWVRFFFLKQSEFLY